MPNIVVVHRYDEPKKWFGIHSNAPKGTLREGVYWTVGLFSEEELQHQLAKMDISPGGDVPLDDLIDCAPIEWHKAMKNGEMLERFTVYTSS